MSQDLNQSHIEELPSFTKTHTLKKIRTIFLSCIAVFFLVLFVWDGSRVYKVSSIIDQIEIGHFQNIRDLQESIEEVHTLLNKITVFKLIPRIKQDIQTFDQLVKDNARLIDTHTVVSEKVNTSISFYFSSIYTYADRFQSALAVHSKILVDADIVARAISTPQGVRSIVVLVVDSNEFGFVGGKLIQMYEISSADNNNVTTWSVPKKIDFSSANLLTSEENNIAQKYYNTDSLSYKQQLTWVGDKSVLYYKISSMYPTDGIVIVDETIVQKVFNTTQLDTISSFDSMTQKQRDELYHAFLDGMIQVFFKDQLLNNSIYPKYNSISSDPGLDYLSVRHECTILPCKSLMDIHYEKRAESQDNTLVNTIWIDYKNKGTSHIQMTEKIYVHNFAEVDVFGIQDMDKRVTPLSSYDFYNEAGKKVLVFNIDIGPGNTKTFVFKYHTNTYSRSMIVDPLPFDVSKYYIELKSQRELKMRYDTGFLTDGNRMYYTSGALTTPLVEVFD